MDAHACTARGGCRGITAAKSKMGFGLEVGAVLILAMFALVLFFQARNWRGANPIVRQRLGVKEPFQVGGGGAFPAAGPATETVAGMISGVGNLLPAAADAEAAEAVAEAAGKRLAPGPAGIQIPREPYTLLNDWLPPKQPQEAVQGAAGNPPSRPAAIPDSTYGQKVQNLYAETGVLPRAAFNSQTCYESDFQTRLEKTGNFRQMTNNYKRGDPDSCSAPNQEVALGYYRTDAIPFEGCMSEKGWPLLRR